jgi:hypothetical protein
VDFNRLVGDLCLEHVRRLELDTVVATSKDPAVSGVAIRDHRGSCLLPDPLPGGSVFVGFSSARMDMHACPPKSIFEALVVARPFAGIRETQTGRETS